MPSKKKNDESKKEILTITYLATKELKKIKYKEIKQAYNMFVSALKLESENVRNREHFWVLGIDAEGFVVCVYTVSLGSSNVTLFSPAEVFQYAINRNCTQVILAHNHPAETILKASEQDIEMTNFLYHAARFVGIQVLDHIIISLTNFLSLYKIGEMQKIIEDMKFKTYDEIKPKLDAEKEYYGKQQKLDGILEKAINMTKEMLTDKADISKIIKYTKLTKKEIKQVAKSMQIDAVKKMLSLSPNEIDEIVKVSTLTRKEILKIKKEMGL